MFKQKKNKRFGDRAPFQDSKILEFQEDVRVGWGDLKETSKKRDNKLSTLPVLIIILVMLIVFIYMLEGYIK